MKFELKDFQKRAVRELLEIAEKKQDMIILDAPTGAGKTIILIDFIDKLLDKKPDTVLIWLTPGTGELEEQSEDKMKQHTNRNTRSTDEVIIQGFSAGDTVFINWEKVIMKESKAFREGERKNLQERVADAHRRGMEFLLIIDEEHRNDTPKAKAVAEIFNASTEIRASATTTKGNEEYVVKVTESEAIAEGLLTKAIYINEDLRNAEGDTEVEVLLRLAIGKQIQIRKRYEQEGKDINPMVLIQVPNNNDSIINEVEEYLAKAGYTYGNKRVSKWLSKETDKINVTEDDLGYQLTKNDAEPMFLIMKQAIATGWDAPRAKILVKLRENMSEQFTTQTIGRIRRMPEAVHYEDSVLDTCFLYTYDEDYVDGAKRSFGDICKEAKLIHLKDKHKDLKLTKEVKVENAKNINENKLLDIIRKGFVDAYHLKDDFEDNKKRFLNYGYDMGTIIVTKTRTGILKDEISADYISDLDRFDHKVEIDKERHRIDLKKSTNEIAAKLNVRQYVMDGVLKTLFSKTKGAKNRLLSLPYKEYLSFIIINKDRLQEIMKEIVEISGENVEIVQIEKEEVEFRFPDIDIVSFNKKAAGNTDICAKNVYNNYPATSIKASRVEELFEVYCESNSGCVEFWYKNREDKNESFSILYKDKLGTVRYFFPDYLLKDKSGKLWIIETKGGETQSKADNNIDKNVVEKFQYLKEYSKKHGVEFGFVRDSGSKLYFKSDEYKDDMQTWVKLEDVL